jgi:hypothetical protein
MGKAENRTLLKNEDGLEVIVAKKGLVLITGILRDEKNQLVDAGAFTALTLTLYNRDSTLKEIINSINGTNILNTGRGTVGTIKTVTGATNAAPIVVTVAAHGYASADRVAVERVKGNLGANGDWRITVLDADTFELNGSTGTGAYVSGGSAVKAMTVLLQDADHTIVDATQALEYHRALIQGTYSGGKPLKYEIDFPVENLDKVA